MYRFLLEVAADTLQTIAADPKHLGAKLVGSYPNCSCQLYERDEKETIFFQRHFNVLPFRAGLK